MKILLIKPPQNPNLTKTTLYEPLELEYLAASLRGLTVRILDMRIDRNLHRDLVNFKPDLVGISAYTCEYNTAVQILKEIRLSDKSIKTVVGGHHASFMPDDFVLPWVDCIFIGYADHTLPQYINALGNSNKLKEIPNIGIVENNSVFFTKRDLTFPDLNSLPMPDRSLTYKYRNKYHDSVRNRLSLLMTSRGCSFRCNFCACWKLMEGKYAARTPESIINELKSLPEEIEAVYFSDDNTFNDIERMWKLSALIKKNGIKKKLQMYARADTIVRNQALFEDLAGAGLQFLTVGIESFRNSDLDFYKKKTTVEINTRAIHILKKLNIHILAHVIVRPEYSKDDFRQLLSYVYENNLFRPGFPVLTPLPGTELYQNTRDSFVITNFDFFDFVHAILPTKLGPKDFYRQLTNLYIKSYSVSRLIKHRFNRLFSLNKKKYYTDNTDGVTIRKLLIVYLYSVVKYFKLRYFSPVASQYSYHRKHFTAGSI
jgi:radical SAM superfamily enzyme YgiQ (UPF0313 family)